MAPDIRIAIDRETARTKMQDLDESVKMVEELRSAHWTVAFIQWQGAFALSEVTYDMRLAIAALFDKVDEVVRQCVLDLCELADYYATFIKELDATETGIMERLDKMRSELDPDFRSSEDDSFEGTRGGFRSGITGQQPV
ncbi:MAG: hypothetical protein LBJ02_11790 [Bifidobacteriaceae bacterium]|jgi:hypothetical protein|nr:hypothetical protein [Bifidobacteriaceae bacterium]